MAKSTAVLNILLSLDDKATAALREKLGLLKNQAGDASKKVGGFGASLRKHWLGATVAIAGFMVAARGISNIIMSFAEFEKGLANIKILLGENKHEIVLFEKEVKRLSTTWGIMTKDLNKSAFDIQSAIGNTAKSLDILNAGTKLAVAGGSDLNSTTSGLVTLMESYGKSLRDAEDAADLLFITQVRARATIGELSQSVGSFLPLSAKLGVSAEDVLASYAKMTVVLGNVSESGTAMTGILNGLIKPTKELTARVEKWFGVSVQQAVQQGKFLQIMERLGEVSEEEIGRMIPRIRGLKGLLAVSQAISSVQEQAEEFRNRAGITEKNAAEQMKTTKKQVEKMVALWHEMNIELGEVIANFKLIQGIVAVLKEFKDENARAAFVIQTVLQSMGISLPTAGIDFLIAKAHELTAAANEAKEANLFSAEEEGRRGMGLPPMPTDDETIALQEAAEARFKAILEDGDVARQIDLEKFLGIEEIKLEKILSTTQTAMDMKKRAVLAEIDLEISLLGKKEDMNKHQLIKEKALQQARVKITRDANLKIVSSYAQVASNFANSMVTFLEAAQGESKKFAGLIKGIKTTETVINTAAAVMKAWAEPTLPYPLNAIMATSIAAMGAAQIATIASAHTGGIVGGSGEVPIIAQRGEGIISRRGMAGLGAGDFDRINGGGGIGVSVSIENASFRDDADVDALFTELSETIEEQRRSRV